MYFPYIRAKQYDLAAITEIDTAIFKKDKVVPIIEPVATIKKGAYKKLSENKVPFLLVVNPIVGDLASAVPEDRIVNDLINDVFKEYKNYWVTFVIQPQTTLSDVENFVKKFPNNYHAYIHFHRFRDVVSLAKLIKKDKNNHYNVFIDNRVDLSYVNQFTDNDGLDILIKDGFKKRTKNADYPEEDHFYDLHLIYESELNYDGFGDFTVIGSQFDDGGGPAYVVALHLTDIDESENLVIKHFKSDMTPPLTATDPGGKFRYALKGLKKYVDGASVLETQGLAEYLELHKTGHFPGLGIPKKIAIMHHIETVHSFL